jgi:NADH:ubiquinone oxidoreductase subunit E
MKITICIGSSCHLKGSRQIVERLQALVAKNNLSDSVELGGTFCMGNCTSGVSVTVDGKLFSLSTDTVEDFFENEILQQFCNISKII